MEKFKYTTVILGMALIYCISIQTLIEENNTFSPGLTKDNSQYGKKKSIKQQLLPMEQNQLNQLWRESYACDWQPNDGIGDIQKRCFRYYMTANSRVEAKWMQRHGYPSRGQLQLLDDKPKLKAIQKLSDQLNTQAMTLMVMAYRDSKNYPKAIALVQRLRHNAPLSQSFAHRLYADTLIESKPSNNDMAHVLAALSIAALLGDSEARIRVDKYFDEMPYLQDLAQNHANAYINKYLSKARVINDKRPEYRNQRGAGLDPLLLRIYY
jgi:hypothetical protein